MGNLSVCLVSFMGLQTTAESTPRRRRRSKPTHVTGIQIHQRGSFFCFGFVCKGESKAVQQVCSSSFIRLHLLKPVLVLLWQGNIRPSFLVLDEAGCQEIFSSMETPLSLSPSLAMGHFQCWDVHCCCNLQCRNDVPPLLIPRDVCTHLQATARLLSCNHAGTRIAWPEVLSYSLRLCFSALIGPPHGNCHACSLPCGGAPHALGTPPPPTLSGAFSGWGGWRWSTKNSFRVENVP